MALGRTCDTVEEMAHLLRTWDKCRKERNRGLSSASRQRTRDEIDERKLWPRRMKARQALRPCVMMSCDHATRK
ncbi:hypothetical protein IG631_18437 [Alternaria alternata]|nr:hypothetical protein IG631_18437 [Alternaria alternata]